MLSSLLLLALSATGPTIETPAVVDGWHFAAVPLFSYGSDVGLTLGAGVFFYHPLPDHPEELDELTLGASYATRGPRSFDVGWAVRRILGTSLRSRWNVHLGDDPQMPYWGEGAGLGGLGVPTGYGTPPAPYSYHDRRLFAAATLRGALAGPLGWHLRARFLDVDVAEPSALLLASAPPGFRGGRVALGEVGLLYDSRDREVETRSGVFATAAAFAAPQLDGISDFAFHGYDGAVRIYVPLPFRITLAMRGLYDRKIAGLWGRHDASAAVPFFERMEYEGIAYDEGLGGAATIRGIARFRVQGDEKLLGNVQLRAILLTTHLASKSQDWGVAAGVDAGWARQPGYPSVDAAGVTAGIRFVWDQAIVSRIEVGRARGGDNTLYVSFGEQF